MSAQVCRVVFGKRGKPLPVSAFECVDKEDKVLGCLLWMVLVATQILPPSSEVYL